MMTAHSASALQTQENRFSQSLSFIIRILTLPPVMALAAISILHFSRGCFPGHGYLAALCCLSFLPLLPYPICFLIPSLRYRGRFIQRGMAVVFSVIGYVAGTVYCLANGLTGLELCVFLSYLLSGTTIALLSFCFRFKCSGHASGMAGPITLLGMQVSPLFFFCYALLIPVFVSSLQLKRHSKEELVAGALTPSLLLLVLIPLLA